MNEHANEPVLLIEQHGRVARLTLNRPKARNSLSSALKEALLEAFADIEQSPDIRAVILAANGPVFCSGHDLREKTAHREDADGGREFFTAFLAKSGQLMKSVVRCPKPVIAEVQGPATAAGVQLVASCDLAVASENAGFSTPGVDIGLFCSTPMVALSRNVARKHAMEMLLTGEMIAARRAAEIGLVNTVVAADQLQAETLKLATKVAGKPRFTVENGKEAFYKQLEMDLDSAYALTSKVMVENMMVDDAREGIGAFLEKRKPDWDKI